ncbi:hypothetical protein B932_0689 [Gluconobacter oxydans H24]|nr:hypothetical protein B932_0689 [Gluconobacter oxydans H24]GAC89480.1 hypothetical protein NBRC3255_3141 [Gluconobacter thailandicus NBRC 3255]
MSPVLDPAKHDLDAITVSVSALVVSDGRCSGFLSWNAGLYPLFPLGHT